MVTSPATSESGVPLELGRVLGPHGLRGELRVQLHWGGSTTLFEVAHVELAREGVVRSYAVTGVRRAAKFALLKLEGVDDRDQADTLRGATVSVQRRELPELEEGEYYLADLVGATVVAPDGVVGVVERIGLHPTIDTLLIRTEAGELLEQPLLPHWVVDVDVAARRVELSTREGLI